MRAPPGGWIAFVNHEAEELKKLQPTVPVAALRGHLRDRLRERFPFPLQTVVRALVVGARHSEVRAGGAQASVARNATRYLEVVPAGLTRDAAALTGPLLFPCERPLAAGSVLTAALVLEDPVAATAPGGPGLVARVVDFTVEVAVEP